MADPSHPDDKIIVDEDWKSQVQAEKAAAEKAAQAQQTAAPAPAGDAPAAEPAAAAASSPDAGAPPPQQPAATTAPGQSPSLPTPTMSLLFTSLATQAMFGLGLIADPQTGQTALRLDEARHVIDTLQLLEDKTRGNLTPQEQELLTRILYELRLEFVAARDQPNAGAPQS